MKLTTEEEDVIRDLRAMAPEMALAWTKTGAMLAGRLTATAESGEREDEEKPSDTRLTLIAEQKPTSSYLMQSL